MKDTERPIEHILYFDGVPNMQRLNQVRSGERLPETLQTGSELEREQARSY